MLTQHKRLSLYNFYILQKYIYDNVTISYFIVSVKVSVKYQTVVVTSTELWIQIHLLHDRQFATYGALQDS